MRFTPTKPAVLCTPPRTTRKPTSPPASTSRGAASGPVAVTGSAYFGAGRPDRSLARRGTARRPALPQQLPHESKHERRVVREVARQQPARLLGDPVDPLEAALLHP